MLSLRHKLCTVVCSNEHMMKRYSTFEAIDPYSGKAFAEVPEDSEHTVLEKFSEAEEGHKKWKKTSMETRQSALLRFAELLQKNTDALAATVTLEMGKPISQSRYEIRSTGQRIKYFVDNVHKVLEPKVVYQTPKLVEKVIYEPLGVIANISSWNYPYFVSTNILAPALMTGNSVLFKPSEYSSCSGMEMADLLHKAGIPRDVFVTTTGRAQTGRAVSSLPGLGSLFFTGSNATGRLVAEEASRQLTKVVQLELGGKDPTYVKKDVNVKKAATALANGAFYNAGQSCCSVERIYVDREIFEHFVEDFVSAVKAFKVGDPRKDETFIGPLARSAHVSFLQNQLEDAVQKGAKVAWGASQGSFTEASSCANFFPPTVLTDVDHRMDVMREESFGPIIGIQSVEGESEALQLMQDTNYGLTAGVFCQHSQDAERILSELNVGSGYWNCCDRTVPRLPWSGRKGSGIGSSLSIEGLQSCVQPKSLHLQNP